MTSTEQNDTSATVTEILARFAAGVSLESIPNAAREAALNDLLDVAGLCVAARNSEYVRTLVRATVERGDCTAIGHSERLAPIDAALINGTAAHGEDFDDTLEGAGIRLGAIVIPAVLAAGERHAISGSDALSGIIVGLEVVARVSHAAPGAPQKAGFHHVGVMGVFGAAVGVARALGSDAEGMANAIGLAGSFSSGLITESDWTKRLHPGVAASNGYRAALLGMHGYRGPTQILDGDKGFFRSFTPGVEPDLTYLKDGLGSHWLMQDIAFKAYACATTVQPFVDCMIGLAKRGIEPNEIVEIVCLTSPAVVSRQWEPAAEKRAPASGYAAKYSAPFSMAVAFFDGDAGLAQFSDQRVRDEKVLRLADKIRYVIDDSDPYPENYVGRLRAFLRNGSVVEETQPHMRGGKRQPLSRSDLMEKFRRNLSHGGWSDDRRERLAAFCLGLADAPDLKDLSLINS